MTAQPDAAAVCKRQSREGFGAFQKVPRNCWYVAAGRSELGETPISRKIAHEPVVLYRTAEGFAVAQHDACPHRGYPLSKGTVLPEGIQCRYHGMVFDGAGQCIRMARPQDAIPGVMRVRTFPLVEKWHWVWIWVGDPALADPALIPDFDGQDNATYDHRFYDPMGPINGNYQLIHDNLCDASHTSFLHTGLLDDPAEMQMALADPILAETGPSSFSITRVMRNFVPNPMVAPLYALEAGQRYNRLLIGWHHMPHMVVFANRYYAWTETFDPAAPGQLVSEHITALGITPCDAGSSFHFTAASTSWQQSDQDRDGLLFVIRQDLDAFESIQRYYEEYHDEAVEISVANDRPGVLSRRINARLVQEEAA
jgi:phenylpropionate dioxygenase-like ring-hydroxylating dioxygenase large terminal subunit